MDQALFELERVTGAAPVITTDHQFIHAGQAFTIASKVDIATTKIAGVQFTTPATGYIHFRPVALVAVGGPIIASLLEDYSFAEGSALTGVNRRRVGTPTAAAMTVKALPDMTAVAGAAGATLATYVINSASQGSQKVGGDVNGGEEWVLKPGTNYLLAMTNTAGTTSTVGFEIFWYEEDAG